MVEGSRDFGNNTLTSIPPEVEALIPALNYRTLVQECELMYHGLKQGHFGTRINWEEWREDGKSAEMGIFNLNDVIHAKHYHTIQFVVAASTYNLSLGEVANSSYSDEFSLSLPLPLPLTFDLERSSHYLMEISIRLDPDDCGKDFSNNNFLEAKGHHRSSSEAKGNHRSSSEASGSILSTSEAKGSTPNTISLQLLRHPWLNPSWDNNRFLTLACMYNRIEVVKALLSLPRDKGINPMASGNNAFLVAVEKGNLELVEILFQDDRVDVGAEHNLALHIATARGQRKMIELLKGEKRWGSIE